MESSADPEILDGSPPNADNAVDDTPNGVPHELLFFLYDGDLYAVSASSAEAVIPWRAAARIPGAGASIAGVIQDRGRIVVLLEHPGGNERGSSPAAARRIVVCTTARGLVGLPAFETKAIETLSLAMELTDGGVYECRWGSFSYLDPRRHYGGRAGSDGPRDLRSP